MSALPRATRIAARRDPPHPARRSLRLFLAGAATYLLLGAAACNPTSSPPGPKVTATAQTSVLSPTGAAVKLKPEKGGSVVVAVPGAPGALNFSLAHTTAAGWILDAVDARLVRLTPEGDYAPQLLSDVPTVDNGGISPDGLTWTLHFRPRLAWSDGEPLSAEDFRFTWQTVMNPLYPASDRSGWASIENVAVTDDGITAILTLRHPNAALIDQVLSGGDNGHGGFLLPQHILARVPPSQIPNDEYAAAGHVGSGPFRVAKVDATGQITVERNEHYGAAPALLDRIVFRPVGDPREALGNLGTGEIDLAPSLPLGTVPTLDQLSGIRTVSALQSGAVVMLAFNLDRPPLDNPAVRQAVALGFDRRQAVGQLPGNPPLAAAPLSGTPWANGLVPLPYDPERAARLLDSAGWVRQGDGIRARDGVRLSVASVTLAGREPEAVLRQGMQSAFARDMQRIGIEVVPRTRIASDMATTLAQRDFDIVDLWAAERAGPAEFAARFRSVGAAPPIPAAGNVMGYRSQIVNAAIATALTAPSATAEREALLAAQRQIAQDTPVLPLFIQPEIDAAQSHVQGLAPGDRVGLWWNVAAWWLQREPKGP